MYSCKLRRAFSYFYTIEATFVILSWLIFYFWFSDELYLKLRFRFKMGCWPNLKYPKTFQEKINWLKLHDRNPGYTKMVDKYAVKEYVAKKIGNEYICLSLINGI